MASPDIHRRTMLTGLVGMSLPVGARAAAQRQEEGPVEAIRLIENLSTRVGAEVALNGRGPFVFVIDTGAVQTAIADSLLSALELTPRRLVKVHGITSAEVAPSVDVDTLRLAGQRFRNLKCPVLPRTLLGADGLLGLDVLSRFRLRFNVRDRSASLTIPAHAAINFGSQARHSRLQLDGSPLVRGPLGQMLINEVSTDRIAAAGFIDSGAQYSIGNMALKQAVVSGPDAFGVSQTVTLYGVTGQTLPAELRIVRDLRLGGRRLGSTPLLFADLHCFSVMGLGQQPAMLIGADLLGRFREVSIDFPRRTIAFEGLMRPRQIAQAAG